MSETNLTKWTAKLWDVGPVLVVAAVGAGWIATHPATGRGSVHTILQILALGESLIALLFRHRKPVGTLAGILVVYLAVDLDAVLLLPILLALLNVSASRQLRSVAIATVATMGVLIGMPYLHGDPVNLPMYSLLHLAAVALAVVIGQCVRSSTLPSTLQTSRDAAHQRWT